MSIPTSENVKFDISNATNVHLNAFSFKEQHLGLITGDVIPALQHIPDECINVVITSPPYFWVRDYGVDNQIGHEETVQEYVTKLADVFDEVRRVLHPNGVFYLNIGDTYYSGNGQPHGEDPKCASRNFMRKKLRPVDRSGWDIPKKSLIGIPWKLAFEMQKREWVVRNDIIWTRPNAFSEPSARDRPWRQYEHLFLFAKSRFYSYDRSALEGDGDVWEMPIERAKVNKEHNAPFPTKLVERCIATGSPLGGRVLDPFLGSGTTMVTAMHMGRSCVGVEIKADYVSEVERIICEIGATSQLWGEIVDFLKRPCSELDKWEGHLSNMKKPGSYSNRKIK